MLIDVVIPWRGGCPHREQALAWVLDRWTSAGFTPTVATAVEGEWCKAAAVTPAVEASSADIVIVADADVWCEGIGQAVLAVDLGAGWAIPHGNVHRLDERSTTAVLDGGPLDGTLSQAAYPGHPGGGITVVRRDAYLDAPLDPRFLGWGQEDDAAAIAWLLLYGKPWRGRSPLWHLWHPPQLRQNRGVGSQSNLDLYRRYKAARHAPEKMRALIDEAKVTA